MSNDEQERAEWDDAWSKMQHRNLESWNAAAIGQILTADWNQNEIVTITVTDNPAKFAPKVLRKSISCPSCGLDVGTGEGLPVSIYPTSRIAERELTIGFGAWMHNSCFAECTQSNEPTPIPW
ncbi:hypothetical protein CA85_17500 [Allorhodopirellula solitaria]|uniref:Uncharacterized protein n=1 Tax=Allorhodopirellula solitaria TaxID=2527987 RepID=A0A5C5YHU1_9BACT|nr:hypothetical protein CA85_17500 [Allorhodopirellula solitaria]